MADDESEGDPCSSDTCQPSAFVEMETATRTRVSLPAQVSFFFLTLCNLIKLMNIHYYPF